MNKVIITVLAACAVIGAVWILCADCRTERSRKDDDGLAEALLMAEYARRTL